MPVYQNNVFRLMCNISVPSKESELVNFLVRQEGEPCCRLSLCVCVCVSPQFETCVCVFFSAKREDWKAAKLSVSAPFCPLSAADEK